MQNCYKRNSKTKGCMSMKIGIDKLHRLPVCQHVNFILLIYIYQCLYGSPPRYLFSDIVLHNTQSSSHHYLKSFLRLIILGSTFPKLTVPQAIKPFLSLDLTRGICFLLPSEKLLHLLF